MVTVSSAENDQDFMNIIRRTCKLPERMSQEDVRAEDHTDKRMPGDSRGSCSTALDHCNVSGIPIEFLSLKDFTMDRANYFISMLSPPGMPSNLTHKERMGYLMHVLDPDEQVGFRCVGGLLNFLVTRGIVNSLDALDQPIFVSVIEHLNVDRVLHMSPCTMKALQLFQVEPHPLSYGSGRAKESLSIYGILNVTRSAGGGRLLRNWISAPPTNLIVIAERQKLVAFLRSHTGQSTYNTIGEVLRGVKNVPSILSRLRGVSASLNDWNSLHTSTCALVKILYALRQMSKEPDLHSLGIMNSMNNIEESDLLETARWIQEVIDFPESKSTGRLVVAPGFSEEIDQMRECHAGLDDFLTTCAVEEMKRIADDTSICIPRLQIVYLSQVGYLVLLDKTILTSTNINENQILAAGLHFAFQSPPHACYFKSPKCEELDRDLGDIQGALIDLEAKAIRYLEGKVLPSSAALYESWRLAAELDCLVALATVATEQNWICPTVDDSAKGIYIENGKHALQEVIIPSFIPNSTNARPGSVHVITGPNCSGKSVYCKQVAIIVILAQIGSCVPATSCKLGIIDAIYTRIASYESVSVPQSAFSIDASQVAGMLQNATGNSLVLLDEWGKGTAEAEGMALFGATINELLRRPAGEAPICFAATHFTELLAEPFLSMSSDRLCTFSMEYVVDRVERITSPGGMNALGVENSLNEETVYLYRLLPGSICAESRAIHCALNAGVPRSILVRSIEIRDAVKARTLIPASATRRGGRMERILNSVKRFLVLQVDDENSDMQSFLESLDI
jgi:DNA mismatch repair protein MSH5